MKPTYTDSRSPLSAQKNANYICLNLPPLPHPVWGGIFPFRVVEVVLHLTSSLGTSVWKVMGSTYRIWAFLSPADITAAPQISPALQLKHGCSYLGLPTFPCGLWGFQSQPLYLSVAASMWASVCCMPKCFVVTSLFKDSK